VEDTVVVKITPNEKNNPPGKLADAELHFSDGVLAGLKLMGFAVWERRTGNGRNVTFPARTFAVNGEKRRRRIGSASSCCRPTPITRSAPPSRRDVSGKSVLHPHRRSP
jgi:hypothetical protein